MDGKWSRESRSALDNRTTEFSGQSKPWNSFDATALKALKGLKPVEPRILEGLDGFERVEELEEIEVAMSAMQRDKAATVAVTAAAKPAPTTAASVAGRFMVLPRDHWETLWRIETANRFNLVAAYLVLLAGVTAGTGLTRWSALACERYAGIGPARARKAIAELIDGGLVSRQAVPPGEGPLYRLAERGRGGIFLPLSLVLAPAGGSLLGFLRETGDALLLRMLVDLHGLVRPDPVFGMKLEALRQGRDTPSHPVAGGHGHTIWQLGRHEEVVAAGPWVEIHAPAGEGEPDRAAFWRRLKRLQGLALIGFETWVFDGPALDAEPLFPLPGPAEAPYRAAVLQLDELRRRAVGALSGIAEGADRAPGDPVRVVRPEHCQMPVLRGVARLAVTPATPGLRRAMEQRLDLIRHHATVHRRLLMTAGGCDTPV